MTSELKTWQESGEDLSKIPVSLKIRCKGRPKAKESPALWRPCPHYPQPVEDTRAALPPFSGILNILRFAENSLICGISKPGFP